MFGFFKKKPALPRTTDRVWMTDAAKEKGLLTDVRDVLRKQGGLCVFYYFEETRKALETLFEGAGVPTADISAGDAAGAVVFVPASEIPDYMRTQDQVKRFLLGQGEILFAEHYPLLRKERLVLEKLATLGGTDLNVRFHISLDEPLFQLFGSDRIKGMMTQMGAKEDEAFEHRMITSSIGKAQQKIDDKTPRDLPARSMAEWFALNVREA